MATVYRCNNKACLLGTAQNPGLFTGGISAEQATQLTGNPEPEAGKGICPNCGQPGEKVV